MLLFMLNPSGNSNVDLKSMIPVDVDGIVLLTYGAGNGPNERKDIMEISMALSDQKTDSGINGDESVKDSLEIGDTIIPASQVDIVALQQKCGESEQLIRDNRSALILYC